MAIIQISKIQQRSGNLVDLPQLDEAQFGWANDARRLFIGTTTPNPIENVEVLTSYSNISFSQVEGSGGSNVNITTPIQPGQILGYDVDTNSWVNTGGNTEDPGNTTYYTGIPVHLGTIANVKIGGGATGYVLETDGTGNLNWTSKGTLRNTIIDLAPDSGNGNIIVMTVDANTPYTNGLEITISGANATNANAIVNSQNFFIKVANDFPSTGSVELYLTAALDTPNATDGTNLGVYTANSGIATASLSGGSSANAGGSVNTIQFNDGGILNGSANFTITGGNIVSLTGNFSASNVAGGNLVSANFFTGVLTTNAQPNITSTGTLASLSVTANANVGNLGVGGVIITTGNSTAGNYITAGIVSATGNGTFGNVTATTFNGALNGAATTAGTVTTNAQPNITSTGILTSLSVSGNANIGNIGTAGLITATGNLNAGNIITAGLMSSTGNLTSGNIITGGLITATGNITGANINGTFYGAGTGLTGIPGANVSGQVGNALVAATVYTNAQPNITSLGTLTSISVSGNANIGNIGTAGIVSATGNITAPFFIGNGSQLTGITVAAGSSIVNGNSNVTVAADSNVSISVTGTSNVVIISNTGANVSGTLSVSGNISGGNLILPNAGNITTGANTNTGTITGNWSLSAGSRLNATYADLAEYYEADAHYSPGTVLAFGGDKEVTLAEDGTNKVAGVVSTDPAYVMNMKCKGEHIVALALQGRVPTKVRGTISKGDMLVSGGDGYARPATSPVMGTVIGKALANFTGEGIIEVAVGRL
jgi:hypothetical protein